MMNINNFLNTVVEDYYTIWTGNIPTKMLPENEYDAELFGMIEDLKTMIGDKGNEPEIELQILDVATFSQKKGYAAGFKTALALAGLDISEEGGRQC